MKTILALVIGLLTILVVCRVTTAHLAASRLRAQLMAAEDVRWRELVATIKKTNPEIDESKIAKGEIEVSILHTSVWVPFSFEAHSIVKQDESMYHEEVAAYWYTPWKIYKRRVLEHFEKVPPLWLEKQARSRFQTEPNQSIQRNDPARHASCGARVAPLRVVADL